MNDEQIQKIELLCDEIEKRMNQKFLQVIDDNEPDVLLNVLLNVGTGTLAKALLMLTKDERAQLIDVAVDMIHAKVEEAEALMERTTSAITARAMSSTCEPPRFKH